MPLKLAASEPIPAPTPDGASPVGELFAAPRVLAPLLDDAAPTLPGNVFVLGVPYYSQRPFQNLCWAACCQMVLSLRQPVPNLCTITSTVLGRNCCDPGVDCDETHWPVDAYHRLGYDCIPWNNAFDLGALDHEIRQYRRPVEAFLEWNGSAHVVVVDGFSLDGQFLHCLDPWFGQGLISYETLHGAYGAGEWTCTYYQLQPTQNGQPPQLT